MSINIRTRIYCITLYKYLKLRRMGHATYSIKQKLSHIIKNCNVSIAKLRSVKKQINNQIIHIVFLYIFDECMCLILKFIF